MLHVARLEYPYFLEMVLASANMILVNLCKLDMPRHVMQLRCTCGPYHESASELPLFYGQRTT